MIASPGAGEVYIAYKEAADEEEGKGEGGMKAISSFSSFQLAFHFFFHSISVFISRNWTSDEEQNQPFLLFSHIHIYNNLLFFSVFPSFKVPPFRCHAVQLSANPKSRPSSLFPPLSPPTNHFLLDRAFSPRILSPSPGTPPPPSPYLFPFFV